MLVGLFPVVASVDSSVVDEAVVTSAATDTARWRLTIASAFVPVHFTIQTLRAKHHFTVSYADAAPLTRPPLPPYAL